ncbi:MAG TPA: isochorismatase family cysteine hydrolase [Xanthobacteraceae bacterium]|nr:isochorismatase family cysteine hydrolase [Xanthobacteraceae bacterium]
MHKISIPQNIIAQVKAQRGRLNRYERLAGPKTALVVIDLQNAFMLPGMPVEVPVAREIVPNVNKLAAATRAAGGKVVWVKMCLEGQSEAWRVFFDGDPRQATLSELTPGAHGFELYADLDVRPQDAIVVKKRYSAFIQGSSELDRLLREAGIDTVMIAGTVTNVCCESSARDAMMLNYRLVFISDGNAALSDADHNATLASILRVFGDIATTNEAIALLSAEGQERAA